MRARATKLFGPPILVLWAICLGTLGTFLVLFGLLLPMCQDSQPDFDIKGTRGGGGLMSCPGGGAIEHRRTQELQKHRPSHVQDGAQTGIQVPEGVQFS